MIIEPNNSQVVPDRYKSMWDESTNDCQLQPISLKHSFQAQPA